MAILQNSAPFRAEKIGMPDSHARAFLEVAAAHKVAILSRATGPTCKGLLEQGYDTKGFRIHGKSCDWGPMAGFVVRDPRLNKNGAGKADYNRKEHRTAMTDSTHSGWSAGTVPLKLFQERVDWLKEKKHIIVRQTQPGRLEGMATHKSGVRFDFLLLKEFSPVGVIWGVYFDNRRVPFNQEGVVRRPGQFVAYEAMLAMTNPREHRSWRGEDFRNAITGDYDLFAVWPYAKDYQHEGMDRRILGTARGWTEKEDIEHDYEANFTQVGGRSQGTKIGNITDRIYEVGQWLNMSCGNATTNGTRGSWGPFPNRNVIWHSDEACRPFVDDVDLPIVAFLPGGIELGIETIPDFKDLIAICEAMEFKVSLGEGWVLTPDEKAKKLNRLGPQYAHLIPEWARQPNGRANVLKVPSWYNS